MGKDNSQQEFRVLIADRNQTTAKQLGNYLKDSHFSVAAIHDGFHLAKKILEYRPHFILIDLTLPNCSAIDCLKFLEENNMLQSGDIQVIVLSSHNAQQNVQLCLKKGASDYIVKPVKPVDVLNRIGLYLQARKRLTDIDKIAEDSTRLINYYLHLTQLLVKTSAVNTDTHEIHFQLLRMLTMALSAVRISLIGVDPSPTILASGDDKNFRDFQLDIEKYPEIAYVLRTQKPLFIENLNNDSTMAFVKEQMQSVQFNSMIVLPIIHNEHVCGILSARLDDAGQVSDAEIRLCQVVAQLISTFWALRNDVKTIAA